MTTRTDIDGRGFRPSRDEDSDLEIRAVRVPEAVQDGGGRHVVTLDRWLEQLRERSERLIAAPSADVADLVAEAVLEVRRLLELLELEEVRA